MLAGMKQEAVAKAVGMAQPSYSHLESKGTGSQLVVQIAQVLGVTPEWLATGTGEMHPNNLAAHEPHATYGTNTLEHAGTPRTARRVPIKGRAKLGDDGFYEDITEDGWVDSYSPDPEAYGIRVKGDSMHPAIRSGAIVVVEPNGACIPAEYVAIALKDGSKMVKELVAERADDIIVESVNGNQRQTIDKADILQIHPVAAVVSPSKWHAE